MNKENIMNKINSLENHLQNHPCDYQGVVSLYKLRSDLCLAKQREREIDTLKELSKIRREYHVKKQACK